MKKTNTKKKAPSTATTSPTPSGAASYAPAPDESRAAWPREDGWIVQTTLRTMMLAAIELSGMAPHVREAEADRAVAEVRNWFVEGSEACGWLDTGMLSGEESSDWRLEILLASLRAINLQLHVLLSAVADEEATAAARTVLDMDQRFANAMNIATKLEKVHRERHRAHVGRSPAEDKVGVKELAGLKKALRAATRASVDGVDCAART